MARVRSKREKMLISMTLAVVIIAGGYFVAYDRLRNMWAQMGSDITQLQDQIQRTADTLRQNQDVEARYKRITTDLAIPGSEEEQQAAILREINQLMESSGIVTRNRRPLPTTTQDNFKVFTFEFNDVECDFESLMTFLQQLDSRASVLEVERLDIRKVFRQGDKLRVRADLKTSRLVYLESKPPAAAAAAEGS